MASLFRIADSELVALPASSESSIRNQRISNWWILKMQALSKIHQLEIGFNRQFGIRDLKSVNIQLMDFEDTESCWLESDSIHPLSDTPVQHKIISTVS
jgi:hypothetical protein